MDESHTVQSLLYDLAELQQAKLTNQRMGTIIVLEQAVKQSAQTARERIIKHAIQAYADSSIGVNAVFVRMLKDASAEPETRTLYVASLFWRNSDPFISIAGFDSVVVGAKAQELANEEITRGIDDEIAADETLTEDEARAYLESEMASTGVNKFTYPADLDTLGIDAEHRAELEQQNLTVY